MTLAVRGFEPSAEDDDEEGIFKTFHHNKTAGARGTQAR